MPGRTTRGPGFTLLEIVTVLTLMGAAVAVSLPAAKRQMDRTAVLGAREEVAGLIHRARASAVALGGASLRLTSDPPAAELVAGGAVVDRSHLAGEYGGSMTMTLSRDRGEVELRFDALGIGRIASQTIRFARGSAAAVLVVSSYGRLGRP